MSQVVASERDRGQTEGSNTVGVKDCEKQEWSETNGVGKPTGDSESLVVEVKRSEQDPE